MNTLKHCKLFLPVPKQAKTTSLFNATVLRGYFLDLC